MPVASPPEATVCIPPLVIVVLLALPDTVSLPPALIVVPVALPPNCTT